MPRRSREQVVTPSDVALLATLSQEPNLVSACRRLGMSRDRGMYRLRRLRSALGAPVVRTTRGGVGAGRTELTPEGRALLSLGVGPLHELSRSPGAGARVLEGVWRSDPEPVVELRGGLRLRVSFRASPGDRVVLAVDPESIVLARRRFPTSARNVLEGRVRSVGEGDPTRWSVDVETHGTVLPIAVTPEAVRSLRLRRGTPVFLYLKATAIRPLAISPAETAPSGGSTTR